MGKGAGLLSAEVPVQAGVPAEESRLKINAAKAVELLTAQVAKKGPDYKYPRRPWQAVTEFAPLSATHECYNPDQTICVNWIPGEGGKREPDCIMGHVYADLGVLDRIPATVNVYGATHGLARAGIVMTARAQRVFFSAQTAQDRGFPWGVALDTATRFAEEDTAAYDDTEYRGWILEAF